LIPQGVLTERRALGMSLRLPAVIANIEAAIIEIRNFLREHQLNAVLFDMELLAREAILNAVKHGCQERCECQVHVSLDLQGETLQLHVVDEGPGFAWQTALSASPPDPEDLSGRGLIILQHYADEMTFTPPGNALTLIKRLPAKEQHMSQKTLTMSDRISAQDAPTLREQFKEIVHSGVLELTLDFAPVESIDSVGIGLLVAAHNSLARNSGQLRIVNASRNVYQLLTLMRLDKHFSIAQA